MKDFKRLKIWQKVIEIAKKVYQPSSSFPKKERFGIGSQMTRAAISISSNIVKGSSRTSEKDYRRFLEISLGSTYELETQFLIPLPLGGGDSERRNDLLKDIIIEQKTLISFINTINYQNSLTLES